MGLGSSTCCEDATPVEAKEVVQESCLSGSPSIANSQGIIDLQKLQVENHCECGNAEAIDSTKPPTQLPNPSPTVSSAIGSRSTNPRNLRNLTRFQIDQSLLRGISLRRSLRSCGKLWTRSPLDLPDAERAGLWAQSEAVERLNTFLSHTWATPGWQKVVSLLVQSGGVHFLLGWLSGVLLGVALDLGEVLPPLLSFPCGAENIRCERGIWVRVFGFLGSMAGLWGSPYMPQFHTDMCFLDVVSINQADPDLMGRGIYGLGGFLAVSSELRILWSRPYLTRLWCIFEMAAFRKANPTGKIILKPLFLETFVVCAVFCLYIWLVIDEIRMQVMFMAFMGDADLDQTTAMLQGTVNPLAFISLIPVIWCFHQCRRLFREKLEVVENLKNFDLAKVSCRTAEDREFIYHGIQMWYGSTEAFEEYVRGPLATELTEPFSRTQFPFVYWMMLMSPLVAVGLDNCLSYLTSSQQDSLAVFYFCINTTFTACVVVLLCGRWALSLAERLAPKARSWQVDYGKTLLMWLLVVLPMAMARIFLAEVSQGALTLVCFFIGLILCVLVFQRWPYDLWRKCSKISA